MYKFETLSHQRRQFVLLAKGMFPELTTTINRKQIQSVSNEHGITFPQWLTIPENTVSRGTYNFPLPKIAETKVEPIEDIETRIRETYESMDELVKSVAQNTVNSLVIAGGAGLGKSYNVNQTLKTVNNGENGYIFHRGYLKATHLFRMLYENRFKGMVIVLDDCDIWGDETALNILKAALELKPTRRIGWGSEKIFLDEDGEEIPRYFDFEGSVIFLTNLNVRDLINSGSKYAPHLSAIESRSLVLDLKIKTKKEYLVVIKMKLEQGLLSDKGLFAEEESEIMQFVTENVDNLVELSLRMVEKIASLYIASPTKWKKLCKAVCCK